MREINKTKLSEDIIKAMCDEAKEPCLRTTPEDEILYQFLDLSIKDTKDSILKLLGISEDNITVKQYKELEKLLYNVVDESIRASVTRMSNLYTLDLKATENAFLIDLEDYATE